MAGPRFFVDANILVSAFLVGGKERELLDKAHRGILRLVSSSYVLKEMEGALTRLGFLENRVIQAILYARSVMEIVDVSVEESELYQDLVSDRSDSPVVAAAAKSGCPLITGDKKLRNEASKVLKTLTTREALEGLAPD